MADLPPDAEIIGDPLSPEESEAGIDVYLKALLETSLGKLSSLDIDAESGPAIEEILYGWGEHPHAVAKLIQKYGDKVEGPRPGVTKHQLDFPMQRDDGLSLFRAERIELRYGSSEFVRLSLLRISGQLHEAIPDQVLILAAAGPVVSGEALGLVGIAFDTTQYEVNVAQIEEGEVWPRYALRPDSMHVFSFDDAAFYPNDTSDLASEEDTKVVKHPTWSRIKELELFRNSLMTMTTLLLNATGREIPLVIPAEAEEAAS